MSRPNLSYSKCQSYPPRDDSRGLFCACCLSGRVISPLGGSRDGGPPIHSDASLHPMPILSAALPAMRDWDHTVTGQKRIFSGLAAIDFFYPLARGHRMALAGPACVIRAHRLLTCLICAQYDSITLCVPFLRRNCGKSTMALDIILHQRLHNEQIFMAPSPNDTALAGSPSNSPLHCIYVSIGKTKAAVQDSVSLLQSHGALAYTTVVAALDKDPAMFQVLPLCKFRACVCLVACSYVPTWIALYFFSIWRRMSALRLQNTIAIEGSMRWLFSMI
jgi:F0F1-type ATP synthase alpha subunit